MKVKDLAGWESAVDGAKQIFTWVSNEAFEKAGDFEAPPGVSFINGPNDAYVWACKTGLVRLPNGRPAKT